MLNQSKTQNTILLLLGASWIALFIYQWVSVDFILASLTLVLASASFFIMYKELAISPRKRIAKIHHLAKAIDQQMDENPQSISLSDMPVEIRPIVESLNALIKFQVDRYQQERDFTANASHELRTPLAGIRLQTEIAMMTENSEQRNNALNNVLKAVDRGTRLVEQLLVLSRLTLDKVTLDVTAVNLSELCQQKVSEYKSTAQNKSIQLTYSKPSTSCALTASETSLDIMLDNLLRNAINHTPMNGDIHTLVKQQEENIVIEVADTGPGIPKEDRERVFYRFQKATGSGKSGTGLGLAIVKRIVDLHHGNIRLDFSENNRGLKVIIDIPINKAPLLTFDSDIAENSLQQVQN